MKKTLSMILVIIVFLLTSCAADMEVSPFPPADGKNYNPNELYYDNDKWETIGDNDALIENDFIKTQTNPVSTFSADVDTASYTYFRKMVNSNYSFDYIKQYGGKSLRTEEMINYFSYDTVEPVEGDMFGVKAVISDCMWNVENKMLMLTLKAKEVEIPPAGNNLVFLIDVSGSMDAPDKLDLLKKAFSYLVARLTEKDKVSIVTYSGREKVVLENCPGNQTERIMDAINSLVASGSTNGEAGLKEAYKIAESCFIQNGNNRIILASDGDLNVGMTSVEEIKEFVAEKRESGIYISVLGFGTGNYRDAKMETIADNGNGVYYYVDSESEAEKIFGSELVSTLYTVAKDVKFQITFNPAIVKSYRLIGYENRMLNTEDFQDDKKDAGEVGSGHALTVCYELVLEESEDGDSNIANLAVRWKEPDSAESTLREYKITTDNFTSDPGDDFKFVSAVIETAMLLHQSKHAGNSSFTHIKSILEGISLDDPYKEEFKSLITKLALYNH